MIRSRFLTNRSGVEKPGGFAKNARTSISQYFWDIQWEKNSQNLPFMQADFAPFLEVRQKRLQDYAIIRATEGGVATP
jgi:hypothetical protein